LRRVCTVYEPNLKRYEQELLRALISSIRSTRHSPTVATVAARTWAEQQNCCLHRGASTKAHVQKLQQYEREFTASIHQQYPLNQDTRQQLQLQQSLGLREEIIDEIEARVTQGYEQKLNIMTLANSCNCCGKVNLQGNVASIEKPITAIEADHKQNLQQYQEFTRAIQWQYPLSDDEHDSWKLFGESQSW